tara:strand:- start:1289 stop:2041 length:753 start_codon:yes stop_codon:yes gene_type:complete
MEHEAECNLNNKTFTRNILGIEFLIHPPSICFGCDKKNKLIEKIPVISWIWMRGKCRNCGYKIPFRFVIIEIFTGILTLFAILNFGLEVEGLLVALLLWVLLVISFIDIDERLIPDRIVLPFLWVGLFVNSFEIFTSLNDAVLGAIFGYLIFWFPYQIFKYFTNKEGMGYGDFKLLSLLGAWLGLNMLPLIIILASIAGMTFGITQMIFRKKTDDNFFAFGPFLAISGVIGIFWGESIITSYHQFFYLSY